MNWGHKIISRPIYVYTGSNQYGDRYKTEEQKEFRVATLSSDCTNTTDMRNLILLSHKLDVPVHYDFEDGVAYIEVVSAEAI